MEEKGRRCGESRDEEAVGVALDDVCGVEEGGLFLNGEGDGAGLLKRQRGLLDELDASRRCCLQASQMRSSGRRRGSNEGRIVLVYATFGRQSKAALSK